jgi:hypothetical protein
MLAAPSQTIRANHAALWRNLLIAAVLLGAGCRWAQYAADRSYWHDEACIVLNVRARSAPRLLQKLDYDQAAPPLFLLAERAMYLRFGTTEWALRLMPTLFGVASTVIFALLAWRLMPGPMAVLVTALFACSDQLIARAVEVKPYGTDAAIAALLTWLAVGVTPRVSARVRLATVALVGAVAVWFSYSAALVLAGLCLALLPGVWRENRRTWWAWVGLSLLALAVSFGVLFHTVIRAQQTPELHLSWLNEFADLHRPWIWPIWIPRQLLALCDYVCQPMGPIPLIAGAIGSYSLWRTHRRETLCILIGPILATIAAAIAQRYPLDGSRLDTFLTIDVLLLAGIGMQTILACGDVGRIMAIIGIAALFAVSLANAGYHLVVPRTRAQLRPIARYIADHRQPGDQIFPLEDKEFACYWPTDDPAVHSALRRSNRMPRHFWIVWSPSAIRSPDPFLRWARSFSKEVDHTNGIGGSAYRFETSAPTMAVPVDPPPLFKSSDRRMHEQPQEVFGD